jgi:hypothetical protein
MLDVDDCNAPEFESAQLREGFQKCPEARVGVAHLQTSSFDSPRLLRSSVLTELWQTLGGWRGGLDPVPGASRDIVSRSGGDASRWISNVKERRR